MALGLGLGGADETGLVHQEGGGGGGWGLGLGAGNWVGAEGWGWGLGRGWGRAGGWGRGGGSDLVGFKTETGLVRGLGGGGLGLGAGAGGWGLGLGGLGAGAGVGARWGLAGAGGSDLVGFKRKLVLLENGEVVSCAVGLGWARSSGFETEIGLLENGEVVPRPEKRFPDGQQQQTISIYFFLEGLGFRGLGV